MIFYCCYFGAMFVFYTLPSSSNTTSTTTSSIGVGGVGSLGIGAGSGTGSAGASSATASNLVTSTGGGGRGSILGVQLVVSWIAYTGLNFALEVINATVVSEVRAGKVG